MRSSLVLQDLRDDWFVNFKELSCPLAGASFETVFHPCIFSIKVVQKVTAPGDISPHTSKRDDWKLLTELFTR